MGTRDINVGCFWNWLLNDTGENRAGTGLALWGGEINHKRGSDMKGCWEVTTKPTCVVQQLIQNEHPYLSTFHMLPRLNRILLVLCE